MAFLGKYRRDRERAMDSTTSAEELEELAASPDRETRQRVVQNMNTSPQVLLRLAREFPHEFIENPVLPLLLLENPGYIAGMTEYDLLETLRHDPTPEIFFEAAIARKTGKIADVLMNHSQTTEQVIEELGLATNYDYWHTWIYAAVVTHPKTSPALREKFAARGNKNLQFELAKFWIRTRSQALLPEQEQHHGKILEILSKRPSKGVLLPLVNQSNYPSMQIGEILKSLPISVLPRIAKEHTVAEEVLVALSKHPIPDSEVRLGVRRSIARNCNTPNTVLEQLIFDSDVKVRIAVAQRSHLSFALLIQLAHDPEPIVIQKLLENKLISAEMLTELALRPELSVRQLVAQHRNTPLTILADWVSVPELHAAIAANLNAPTDILVQLKVDASCDIPLARNPNTPDAMVLPILERLAVDQRASARKLVARHPRVPASLLTKLANDPDTVVSAIAKI
jgi:hypothetical protein